MGASAAAPAAHAEPGAGKAQGVGAAAPPAHQNPAGHSAPNSSDEPATHAEPAGAEQGKHAAAEAAPGFGLNMPTAHAAHAVPGVAEKRPEGQG